MSQEKNIRGTAAMLLVLLVCVFQVTSAEAEENQWQLRVAALSMNPTGNSVVVEETGEQIPFGAGSGWGFGFDIEYRPSSRLGIDFGVLTARPDINVLIEELDGLSATAKPRITPVFAALNIHLTPDSPVDLYLGPMLAYVIYSDFDLVVDSPFLSESFTCGNDVGYGVNIGLDIRLGDAGWLLTANTKYLVTTLEASSSDGGVGRTDIDPWIFSVGFGYRF